MNFLALSTQNLHSSLSILFKVKHSFQSWGILMLWKCDLGIRHHGQGQDPIFWIVAKRTLRFAISSCASWNVRNYYTFLDSLLNMWICVGRITTQCRSSTSSQCHASMPWWICCWAWFLFVCERIRSGSVSKRHDWDSCRQLSQTQSSWTHLITMQHQQIK